MKIVIAEDSIAVQTMLREAFSAVPGLEIQGLAPSCATAVDLVRKHQPDIVTLDLKLNDGSSIAHIPEMLALRPGLLIIVFSLNIDPLVREKVLHAGATHCFYKEVGVGAVVQAILGSTMTTCI